jgi:hypothetical protein
MVKSYNELRYEEALIRIKDQFRTTRDRHNGAIEMGSIWGVSNDLLCDELDRWEQYSKEAHRHMASLIKGIDVEKNVRMVAVDHSIFSHKRKMRLTEKELDAIKAALDFAYSD